MSAAEDTGRVLSLAASGSYKVVVVDDHAIVRSGVGLLLQTLLGDDVVVLEASSIAEAIVVFEANPDVALALLDLSLPDSSGLEGLYLLRGQFPDLPLVIISANEDCAMMLEAYRAGVLGFIPKTSNSKITLSALRLVIAGGQYLPVAAMSVLNAPHSEVVEEVEHPRDVVIPEKGEREPARWERQLSARQMEVLRLMIQGKPNKEIARDLALSVGTVKNHVAVVLRALDASNRSKAVMTALMAGVEP